MKDFLELIKQLWAWAPKTLGDAIDIVLRVVIFLAFYAFVVFAAIGFNFEADTGPPVPLMALFFGVSVFIACFYKSMYRHAARARAALFKLLSGGGASALWICVFVPAVIAIGAPAGVHGEDYRPRAFFPPSDLPAFVQPDMNGTPIHFGMVHLAAERVLLCEVLIEQVHRFGASGNASDFHLYFTRGASAGDVPEEADAGKCLSNSAGGIRSTEIDWLTALTAHENDQFRERFRTLDDFVFVYRTGDDGGPAEAFFFDMRNLPDERAAIKEAVGVFMDHLTRSKWNFDSGIVPACERRTRFQNFVWILTVGQGISRCRVGNFTASTPLEERFARDPDATT
jgi:hypothetical protein